MLAGIAAALFGLLRRTAVPFGRTALGVCVFNTFAGPLLELNQWLLDVSPYPSPRSPQGSSRRNRSADCSVLMAALTYTGVIGFRRRDIVSSA